MAQITRITKRDQKIIKLAWLLQTATGSQIGRLAFDHPGQYTNRRLCLLCEQGYLRRIARRRKNQEAVYALGRRGADLLMELTNGKYDVASSPIAADGPALTRRLALSEFATRLTLAVQQAGAKQPEWVGQLLTFFESDGFTFEPDGVGILRDRAFFVEWYHQGDEDIAERLRGYLDLLGRPTLWRGLSPQFPPLLYLTTGSLAAIHTTAVGMLANSQMSVWIAAWPDLERLGVLADVFYRVQPGQLSGPASLWQVVGN